MDRSVNTETLIVPGTDRYWLRQSASEQGWRMVGSTRDIDTFEPVETTRLDLVVYYRVDARGRTVAFQSARIKDVRRAGERVENRTESIFVAKLWLDGHNADPTALDQRLFEHRNSDGSGVRLSKVAARRGDNRPATYHLTVHHREADLCTVVALGQEAVESMADALQGWFGG